ncbi:MAG: competence protein CoiA [Hyphomicrobiaceae bacterium]
MLPTEYQKNNNYACALGACSGMHEKKHMQFALIDNERIRPSSGLIARCPACGGDMIAKCGQQRVHHWAHQGERDCDPWTEPETPWHRDWKNAFHPSCQEVILRAPSGEKHIADVRTGRGLTIEFQHSHLRPDERAAREQFYKDMMWVVDGARLKRDLPRFLSGFRGFRTVLHKGLYITPNPQEVFPSDWLHCKAPVFFDFKDASGPGEQAKHARRLLWCLLPGRALGHAVVLPVSREDFVLWAHTEPHPIRPEGILTNIERVLAEHRRRTQLAALVTRHPQGWRLRALRRRTGRF